MGFAQRGQLWLRSIVCAHVHVDTYTHTCTVLYSSMRVLLYLIFILKSRDPAREPHFSLFVSFLLFCFDPGGLSMCCVRALALWKEREEGAFSFMSYCM